MPTTHTHNANAPQATPPTRGRCRRSCARALLAIVCAGWIVAADAPPAAAQSMWELTPYRVQLLAAFEDTPELPAAMQEDLLARLRVRVDVLIGPTWEFTAETAPPRFGRDVIAALEAVTVDDLPGESFTRDKVMLLAVSTAADGYRVAVRELDVRTRVFSPIVIRPVRQPGRLLDEVSTAMLAAFAPLAQVEQVAGKEVTLRLKAGALPPRDPHLTMVHPGDAFQPIIRHNDREGNLHRDDDGRPVLPKPVPWTFCHVITVSDEPTAPGQLHCSLHSGLRSALSGRRRGRFEQLALAVLPPRNSTDLLVRSQTDATMPLAGYDVYAHPPDSKIGVLVGRTDYRGRVSIPPGDGVLRVLLVRHGGAPLARLPVVPGLEAELTVQIPDDDQRLEVEGFVTGLQEELVDLVIRREVLMARARARLESGRLDEAKKLIDLLPPLEEAQSDLSDKLAAQRRHARAADPAINAKIESLIADTEALLKKHLAPEAVAKLRKQLKEAR
ncbi:MAG: hypothetical protein HQ567_06860 [Candidatus Nealsonbacteria bacterium]|nr:hypothetical protein [Candidatus Nealsonbacteria bacterium]